MNSNDPFAQFKMTQKSGWGLFAPLEFVTTPAAATLVEFAHCERGQKILDCACGTGVVAITAARKGAQVKGLDLAPALLERARSNAKIAQVEIEFTEGDVEHLPYADSTFDVVLSQFGHMFAPRPEIAIQEMLRVLKPGGTIAFSTWPPDHFVAQFFALSAHYAPPPPGVAPPPAWGEPQIVKERLGSRVKDLTFDRSYIRLPVLSPQQTREFFENTAAPLVKVIQELKDRPGELSKFRTEFEKLIATYTKHNVMRQHFLMSRATKV